MNSQLLLKVGARLLGLYFAAIGLIAIPQVFIVWELAGTNGAVRSWAVAGPVAAQAAVSILIGFLLVFLARETIDPQPHPELDLPGALPTLIQLLGLFLAFGALGPLVKELGESFIASGSWAARSASIAAQLVALIAGLFLIRSANAVAMWLDGMTRSGNATNPSRRARSRPRK